MSNSPQILNLKKMKKKTMMEGLMIAAPHILFLFFAFNSFFVFFLNYSYILEINI